MDAASQWETEAMRESRDRRSRRPAVSQDRDAATPRGEWRTLREASDLTGIPIGTLRKWCRRETVDSYLESDGNLTLRMVEMGSIRERSAALHRNDDPGAVSREGPVNQSDEDPIPEVPPESAQGQAPVTERETMIVPVDAWNKMLNQLGNLHEAGQQLAESRERAAKAETEALFLRERLAEMREAASFPAPAPSQGGDGDRTSSPLPRSGGSSDAEGALETTDQAEAAPVEVVETTSFWRYVARGWKGRRR